MTSSASQGLGHQGSGKTGGVRFAVDTGGTFTDLIVAWADGRTTMHKAPTTPSNPAEGILEAFGLAAREAGMELGALLGRGGLLVHGTTHPINAILTGSSARNRLPHDEGTCRHAGVPRGAGGRSRSTSRSPTPSPTYPRRSPSSWTSASSRMGRVLRGARRGRRPRHTRAHAKPGRGGGSRSASCGASPTQRTSYVSASSSRRCCPACPTRSRTSLTRRSASIAARWRHASMPLCARPSAPTWRRSTTG